MTNAMAEVLADADDNLNLQEDADAEAKWQMEDGQEYTEADLAEQKFDEAKEIHFGPVPDALWRFRFTAWDKTVTTKKDVRKHQYMLTCEIVTGLSCRDKSQDLSLGEGRELMLYASGSTARPDIVIGVTKGFLANMGAPIAGKKFHEGLDASIGTEFTAMTMTNKFTDQSGQQRNNSRIVQETIKPATSGALGA